MGTAWGPPPASSAFGALLALLTGGHMAADGDGRALPVDCHQPLSRREEEVLRLVARGYSSKEIAARYGLSGKTIETYKMRSFTKLGLTGRPDVVRYALEHGWFDGAASDGRL